MKRPTPYVRRLTFGVGRLYLIEGWALGMFMLSATFFAGLLNWPGFPVREAIESPLARRFLMGLAMGLTAAGIIYSPWGKRSGAHMNPAFTLTFLYLNKIRWRDAVGYVLGQFLGGAAGTLLFKALFYDFVRNPAVNYAQTLPGPWGIGPAFAGEVGISFGLMMTVLYTSNNKRTAPYTGWFAACLIMLYITFEDPLSGMSMNPARSVASAVAAGRFEFIWIYLVAPMVGMMGAAGIWKWRIGRERGWHVGYHGEEGVTTYKAPHQTPTQNKKG